MPLLRPIGTCALRHCVVVTVDVRILPPFETLPESILHNITAKYANDCCYRQYMDYTAKCRMAIGQTWFELHEEPVEQSLTYMWTCDGLRISWLEKGITSHRQISNYLFTTSICEAAALFCYRGFWSLCDIDSRFLFCNFDPYNDCFNLFFKN